ncbi:MAG: hypothetical protein HQK83_09775 [Fibrobacteria bacterium]|nr:hypothetical protein [Fibrobacteria bacterium]
MSIQVLFIANNPGSFNVIYPVCGYCMQNKLDCKLYIVNYGKEICEQSGMPYSLIVSDYDHDMILQLLRELNPVVIVTGSGLHNTPLGSIENNFRIAAQMQGMYSISILDHWTSYKERFSSARTENLNGLPDKLFVMDNLAKIESIKHGIPEAIIEISGSPYFDRLKTIHMKKAKRNTFHYKKKIGIPSNKIHVLFVSEPISLDHGASKRGYDEFSVMEDLLSVLAYPDSPYVVGVKLHPREFENKFAKFGNEIVDIKSKDKYDPVYSADIVIGMTSMLLIESFTLGLNCLSYQPDPTLCHPLPYDIPIITTKEEIQQKLELYIHEKKGTSGNPVTITQYPNATKHIGEYVLNRV